MNRRTLMLATVGLAAFCAFALTPSSAQAGRGGRAPARSGSCCAPGAGCTMRTAAPAGSTTYPQAPTPAPVAIAAGHSYTCPMHPTVASSTPGSCPYCHMALSYR